MNPSTISSGFQRCDVYPFNKDAIDCSVSVINPEASLQKVNERDDKSKYNNQVCDGKSTIPPEKAALLQQRYGEGYDIPDDEYMQWLRKNHPEFVTDQAAHSHNCSDLVSQSNSDGQTDNQITPEKVALFKRRYKEGYDIPDNEYMQWLRKNHPVAAPEYPAFFTGSNDDSDLGYPSSLTHSLSLSPSGFPSCHPDLWIINENW